VTELSGPATFTELNLASLPFALNFVRRDEEDGSGFAVETAGDGEADLGNSDGVRLRAPGEDDAARIQAADTHGGGLRRVDFFRWEHRGENEGDAAIVGLTGSDGEGPTGWDAVDEEFVVGDSSVESDVEFDTGQHYQLWLLSDDVPGTTTFVMYHDGDVVVEEINDTVSENYENVVYLENTDVEVRFHAHAWGPLPPEL
jgi:hypothetical protein